MKFGRTLIKYQVPEWAAQYVSYKSLKREIKHAKLIKDTHGVDSASTQEAIGEFVKLFDSEAKKVNKFWTSQKTATERRLRLSKERLTSCNPATLQSDELVETINEIRIQLYLVLRYVEMNRTGFRKILKKFDKKMNLDQSDSLWTKHIAALPFAADTSMEKLLQVVDDIAEQANNLQQSPSKPDHLSTNSPDVSYLHSADVQSALQMDNVNHLDLVMHRLFNVAPGQKASMEEERSACSTILLHACRRKAMKCIEHLLAKQPTLVLSPLPGDINQRTILHRLCVLGPGLVRSPAGVNNPEKDDATLLQHILSKIPIKLAEDALKIRDFLGRTPLHYTALYGMPQATKVLLDFMPSQRMLTRGWGDDDGHTPIFYCVVRGFVDVLLLLLTKWDDVDSLGEGYEIATAERPPHGVHQINPYESFLAHPPITPTSSMAALMDSSQTSDRNRNKIGTPLALACTFGYTAMVRVLLEHGADCHLANEDEETPLHLCARGGHHECVDLLLGQTTGVAWKLADVDAKDRAFGRTALFLAAMEGHQLCVQSLLTAGASVTVRDLGGLNPHEYAVFRAHNEVARLLRPHVPPYPPKPLVKGISSVAQAVVVERAYGHRYLKDECMIRVYLGSLDLRRRHPPVRLDDNRIPAQLAPGTFRLTVSASAAHGPPAVFDLPLLETVAEPIVFYAKDVANVTLQFDIKPAYGEDSKKSRLIGRASAVLSTFKASLWQEKTPIGGSVDVPILSAQSLDIIGTITFEFVVVKPFLHSNLKGDEIRTWKSDKTKVVGHRGLGMNKAALDAKNGKGQLQLGENTLLSFITAGALGAEYVEFDVQLTKDHVPVLYHDFRVWETGYHLPLNSLTLKEFLSLRPKDRPTRVESPGNGLRRRTQSMSDASAEVVQSVAAEKESWPTKGNASGSVQLPFTTLEEALKSVPTKIGFNIEVKYPNLHEAEECELQNAEINLFCDKILEVVFEYTGDRKLYFSSFQPEICWMLSVKQNHYPVFFLTDGGTEMTFDSRCNSLLDAVRFATRAGCLGIVTKVDPILEAPGLIKAIRESGLLLFTYGGLNNEVENAKLQRDYGVDAIIVDKVKKVSAEFQKVVTTQP
ncbi:Glycerophosphoryl diester phosphodiesterase family-domain-containing protein [Phlyctochytrium arcticum]|nr:Glycerophosphoryl diester phosphodiesterase family-domain-containing protein [Phlyctochytrium arcticum]